MRLNNLWVGIISHIRRKDDYHGFYPTGQNVTLSVFKKDDFSTRMIFMIFVHFVSPVPSIHNRHSSVFGIDLRGRDACIWGKAKRR